jgi:stage II sporulation protein AA (anti-sigma F factor antagonist)
MAAMATRRDTWRPTVRSETIGPVMVLTVHGRLGEAGVRDCALRAALTETKGTRALVVDISGVDYLSSPGLTLLEAIAADAAATGQALVVCGFTDPVRIALDLSGLSATLPCAATLDEAMARLTALTSIP